MKVLVVSILIVFFSVLSSGQKIPQFRDYAVSEVYTGKNAKPVITKSDRLFRTRLSEGAKEEPNFAGRYILTAWGCGTSCLMGAVIDAKTGKISWLPGTVCCWDNYEESFHPIVFRLNSRLIILSGLINENEKHDPADSHYYEFKNGKFVYIKSLGRKK